MRATLVATILAALSAVALAQGAPADDVATRVRKSLAAADPLASGSASAELVAADAETEKAVRAAALSDTSTAGGDRAAHLALAWDLAARVRDGRTKPDLAFWLALDELDRDYLETARTSLLARALPEAESRASALKTLADAREVARRFCLDWNEIDHGGEESKTLAALRSAIETAGTPAVPYLFGLLAVPPQATFSTMEPESGITGRQQVRALFALGFLKVRESVPYLVFQSRGPSYTESTTAQGQFGALTRADFGDGADEEARVRNIDAWWAKHRDEYTLALDHLVRRTLRWTRESLTSGDREKVEWARLFGVSGVARVLGAVLDFNPDAEPARRLRQLDAIERTWLAARASPKPPTVDWGWPAVAGDVGKSRFQLQTILRNGPWTAGGNDTLQIQGAVETDEPDVLLSDLYGQLRVTPDDGVERVVGREHLMLDAAHRDVSAVGLDLGPNPKKLASLEFELKLVHVKTWTTSKPQDVRLGAATSVVLPPFEFSLSGEAHWVNVGAASTEKSLRDMKTPWDLVSHRWAAAAAELTDANGKRLDAMSGGGSGGGTVQTYGSMEHLDADIAYPVKVTVRVPATWDVETVRYRFADLDLSRVPSRR